MAKYPVYGGKQRRSIYVPIALSQRLDAVFPRINISAAAVNGISAMVRAAEQDLTFSMPRRVDVLCNRGHSLTDPDNQTQIGPDTCCRACAAVGRRYRVAA